MDNDVTTSSSRSKESSSRHYAQQKQQQHQQQLYVTPMLAIQLLDELDCEKPVHLYSHLNDSNNIVLSHSDSDNEEMENLHKKKRDFRSYFQEIYESRMTYLLRLPLLFYDNFNAGDFYAINYLLKNTFEEGAEIESLGPKSIEVGRHFVYKHFFMLMQVAPDVIILAEEPVVLHDRVIAVGINVCGTQVDYSNKYVNTRLKHYMEKLSSSSSSSANFVTDDGTKHMNNYATAAQNKRTYREFTKTGKQVCFNLDFTVHFVLNKQLSHVEKLIEILKGVKLSVPRKSFLMT